MVTSTILLYIITLHLRLVSVCSQSGLSIENEMTLIYALNSDLLHFVQVKIELPVHMHEKHHVLFTFYHISCESSSKASSKKREGVESLGESAGKSPLPVFIFVLECNISQKRKEDIAVYSCLRLICFPRKLFSSSKKKK